MFPPNATRPPMRDKQKHIFALPSKARGATSDVRFGSEADARTAKRHVRFTPNSDRKSRHAANGHVRFTPECVAKLFAALR
jgi:hypothetical protein